MTGCELVSEHLKKVQEWNRTTMVTLDVSISQAEFLKVALSQKKDNAVTWVKNHDITYEQYKDIAEMCDTLIKGLQLKIDEKWKEFHEC